LSMRLLLGLRRDGVLGCQLGKGPLAAHAVKAVETEVERRVKGWARGMGADDDAAAGGGESEGEAEGEEEDEDMDDFIVGDEDDDVDFPVR
jgi:hypothetical protein